MKLILKNGFLVLLSLNSFVLLSQNKESEAEKKLRQDSIIKEFHSDCALQYNYYVQMNEWQECLNQGLKKDETVAYLWQQKAMPYFKTRKYEAGMVFVDNAVKYNPNQWLPYRAYIKCVFAKTYNEAILDFEASKKLLGNSYEMDHTYNFYIALSYLQLNDFEKAEKIFKEDIEFQIDLKGEAHYLDLFYYGITLYELKRYEEATGQFDKCLNFYNNFAEAQYYKAICMMFLGVKKAAEDLFDEARSNGKKGYTINEDNAIYETFPYKVKW